MTCHVYITISQEGRIARYAMDEGDGALTHQGDVVVPGRPAPVAIDPMRQHMYVARRDDLRINSYRIDASSGELTELGNIPIQTDPCYIATDRTGRYLLSAYYLGQRAAVHRIGDDGALETNPIEDRHTATGAHCFQTDPSNRFAFVPHIDNLGGPNAIFQFKFDEATGSLEPNDPPRVEQKPKTGPRHFCIHPSKDMFYFSNEQGSSVSAYAFDKDAGTLSIQQTIKNLPEGWTGQNSCSQIRMTPDGRFLYAPNRGNDMLAEYAVDAETGLLTSLGHVPTQKIPRVFEIDPSGKFLLSAGMNDGKLGVFRITKSGRLDKTAEYDVGSEPMWVTILPVG